MAVEATYAHRVVEADKMDFIFACHSVSSFD